MHYLSHLEEFLYTDKDKTAVFFVNLKNYFQGQSPNCPDCYELLFGPRSQVYFYNQQQDNIYRDADPATQSERLEIAIIDLKDSLGEEAVEKICQKNDEELKRFLQELAETTTNNNDIKTTHHLGGIINNMLGIIELSLPTDRQLTQRSNPALSLGNTDLQRFDGDPYFSRQFDGDPYTSTSSPEAFQMQQSSSSRNPS